MGSNVIEFPVTEAAPKTVLRAEASSFSRRFIFKEKRLLELPLPARGDVIYYETNSPLAARISHTGRRAYCLNRRINGRPVKMSLGRVGEVLLADARTE